jgi:hypothetical protein
MAYDPKTKKRILDGLIEHLYNPVERDFTNRLNKLIIDNSLIYGNNQRAFAYKGENYAIDKDIPLPRPLNRLDRSLYPIMDQYLKEKEELVTTELPYVVGFITQVLNASDNFPDYFKLLPESIHSVLRKLATECPCRNSQLTEKKIDEIQRKNVLPVELMKQRMVCNLLLT